MKPSANFTSTVSRKLFLVQSLWLSLTGFIIIGANYWVNKSTQLEQHTTKRRQFTKSTGMLLARELEFHIRNEIEDSHKSILINKNELTKLNHLPKEIQKTILAGNSWKNAVTIIAIPKVNKNSDLWIIKKDNDEFTARKLVAEEFWKYLSKEQVANSNFEIYNNKGERLYGETKSPLLSQGQFLSFKGNRVHIEWKNEVDQEFIGTIWNIFLKASYNTHEWYIVTSQKSDFISDQILKTITPFSLSIALLVLISIFLNLKKMLHALRPIEALKQQTIEISKGNYFFDPKIKGRDEFTELSLSINVMSMEIFGKIQELEEVNSSTISAFSSAVDAKSPWTAGHSYRVTNHAVLLAKALNVGDEDIELLREATLLHDIGKIGVPESILDKPDRLTSEEFEIIKSHPVIGYDIVKNIKAFEKHLPIIRHHHERLDGKGYPDGLLRHEIPFLVKIVSVADVFDALISDRPYRSGMPIEKVNSILIDGIGSQFEEQIINAHLELIKELGYNLYQDEGSFEYVGA